MKEEENKGYWKLRVIKEKSMGVYVKKWLKELNDGKQVKEKFMMLVEFVKPDGTIRKHKCLVCGRDMYEVWDSIAKKYTGYGWKCACMPSDMVLGVL